MNVKNDEPILQSFLDDDLYKFNMGQVVFHDFPQAVVTYEFINRGKTKFPPGFADLLRRQIQWMSTLELSYPESNFLRSIPGIRTTYVEWLKSYRFDPGEVTVQQDGDDLFIFVSGLWYRTIFWEVRLMALISELYFKMTGQLPDENTYNRMVAKASNLSKHNCFWADFGTRRRFSRSIQASVVFYMRDVRGFIGTSNVYFALKYGTKPVGTSAHEMVMALSALYGAKMANRMWSKHWSDHFQGLNGIALPDTFTTEVFMRDWDSYYARLFDGVRQDSGHPDDWMDDMLVHYQQLGINSTSKKFVFSDGLNDEEFIRLTVKYRDVGTIIGGIGTFLTNDVGVKPLNIVIKMTTADFGDGPVDVVKLSDNAGKHTGKPEAIARVKAELGIN